MPGKPHLYKQYGYWNCRWGGMHGAGWTMEGAMESMLKQRRIWENLRGMSHAT